MKDFFECLHEFLCRQDKLKAVVSERIYPMNLPQKPTFPCIVYTPITANYGKNLQHESGFVKQNVQFSIHDSTFGKARRVSRLLRGVLKDFSGDMAGQIIEAVHSITDIIAKNNNSENFSIEEFCAILEFEFQYMEEI